MASASGEPGKVYSAESVEELLTCPICLERFTQPKMMPCQHTFCLSCLYGLPIDTPQRVTCPTCRVQHTIPQAGMSAFSENFLVNNLLSLPSLSINQYKPQAYCAICQSSVQKEGNLCTDCAEDSRSKTIDEIHKNLALMKSHLTDCSNAANLRENRSHLEKLNRNFQSEQEKMNSRLDNFIQILNQKKEQMNDTLQQGSEAIELVKSSTEGGTAHFNNFRQEILDEVASKPSLPDLASLKNRSEQFLFWIELICKLVNKLEEFQVKWTMPKADFPAPGEILEEETTKVFLNSLANISLGSEVVQEERHRSEVREDENTESRRHLKNPTSIKAEANGAVGGAVGGVKATKSNQEITRSSQSFSFEEPGANLQPINYRAKVRTPPKTITFRYQYRVNEFFGIVVMEPLNEIAAVDPVHNVVILTTLDGSRRRFYPDSKSGLGRDVKLNKPVSLAYSKEYPNLLFIADSGHNRIVCVHLEGGFEYEFGSHGRGKDKFDKLSAITCFREFILAADSGNQRVSIFKFSASSAVFARNFGQKHLDCPKDIAMASKNTILVTDDHGVKVFDWNGRFLSCFGVENDGYIPRGICVDRQGNVCVTKPDAKRIDVYESGGGRFSISHKEFDYPRFLCFTSAGQIVMTNKDRLLIL